MRKTSSALRRCSLHERCGAVIGWRKPFLLVTDPPYGIELDSEWRDRAGLNGCGPAEESYMKHRTEGHTETTISGDTRADWSEAFELVPTLQVAYVWHASKFTREVLAGLLRIGFLHHQQIIWDKGRTVLTRTLYWFQHEAIGERTRDALRHKRRQGHRVGNIPFGSRLAADGQRLEPDATEQAAVNEIRRLRSEGASLRGIAVALNRREYRTRRGTAWRLESVARIPKQHSQA